MILVVGATGLVGSEICQRLARRGEKVRALVRSSSLSEKVALLRHSGAEIKLGDLKDPYSLAAACNGVEAIISTASATLSHQEGDSIESVDREGQLHLVEAARAANIHRFIFVSFRPQAGLHFPLADAKTQVEHAIQDLNFTILQASWFMEVWLSPALGFDYINHAARIYGSGEKPISWVSFPDVAEMCAIALRHPAAARQVLPFGGPEALSPLEVVARFERISGTSFTREHVPEAALRNQFEAAADPLQKSFAALMLGYAQGDAMDMKPVQQTFGINLTSIDDYARRAVGTA